MYKMYYIVWSIIIYLYIYIYIHTIYLDLDIISIFKLGYFYLYVANVVGKPRENTLNGWPASSWSQLLSMMGLEAVEFRTELYGFGTELWKHDDIQKYIVYIVYT